MTTTPPGTAAPRVGAAPALDHVAKLIDDAWAQQAQAAEAVAKLAGEVAVLRGEVADLKKAHADLSDRHTELLAEFHQLSHTETPTQTITDQYALADAFDVLFKDFDAEISRLYQSVNNIRPDGRTRADLLATFNERALGDMTNVVMDTSVFREHEASARELIEKYYQRAHELRRRAHEAGAHSFVFGVHREAFIDATFQDPWNTCDPGAPVIFAVTPAYYAGPSLILKQRVFTEPPR